MTEKSKVKILIVEDDPNIRDMLHQFLTGEKFDVTAVECAEDALEATRNRVFNMMVFDWELPGISGIELCTQIRTNGLQVPVLFLTARRDISDRITGLDSGGDDYLTKPFELAELSARINALLRRPQSLKSQKVSVRGLTLDKTNMTVTLENKPVGFTSQEFALLDLLMNNPNRVFSSEELLDRAWSTDAEGSNQAVRSAIMRIRAKIDLDEANPLISTIKGFGYKLNS